MERAEYEVSRNKEAYSAWLNAWQERIREDENLTKAYRRRTGLWREFALEAIPIGRFISSSPAWPIGGSVTLRSGNQAFDAEVVHSSGNFFLEVTSTTDIVDAYQREYLNEHSVVPGDPVGINSGADLQRARAQGFPANPGQVLYGNTRQEEELNKVVQRVNAKLARTHYPPNTVLIVNSVDRILDMWKDEKILGWLAQHLGTSSPAPFLSVWLTLEDGRCIKLL